MALCANLGSDYTKFDQKVKKNPTFAKKHCVKPTLDTVQKLFKFIQSTRYTKDMFMKSIGYVRVSREKTQDPASQIKQVVDRGVPMDDIFIDTISGAVAPMERPAYQKMMERLKVGDVTELVCSEYSRIGRTILESLSEVVNILKMGVKIRSLSKTEEGINEYPTVTMQLIAVLLALDSAQKEREHIRERTKWGMQNAKAKGTKSGRPIGRPIKPVDFDAVAKLVREKFLKEKQAIRVLGIKESTFYKAKKIAKQKARAEE